METKKALNLYEEIENLYYSIKERKQYSNIDLFFNKISYLINNTKNKTLLYHADYLADSMNIFLTFNNI